MVEHRITARMATILNTGVRDSRVRLEVVDSRASREVVGLLVKMELKDVMVRFTNGCEE